MTTDKIEFMDGPYDGLCLNRTDETNEDWPFQISFDIPCEFDSKGMLTACIRHTYQLFMNGENNDGENWSVFQYHSRKKLKVEGVEVVE